MKKEKNINVYMYQGSQGYWYIRVDGMIKAGFIDKKDAIWFMENKYPEIKFMKMNCNKEL